MSAHKRDPTTPKRIQKKSAFKQNVEAEEEGRRQAIKELAEDRKKVQREKVASVSELEVRLKESRDKITTTKR